MSTAAGKPKKDRHIRKREHDAQDWQSDHEHDQEIPSRKRPRGDDNDNYEGDGGSNSHTIVVETPESEAARRERERLADIEDRDAFAERVRNRDRERTKKIVDDRTSKMSGDLAEAALRRQLADDPEARGRALPSLRQHSRQDYLTKRELQQIELLRKEIADDAALFRGMKISKREHRELERKKELLKLVEERMRINDRLEGYQLPEDYITEQGKIDKKKKERVLYQRYDDAKPKDDQFITDIDQWEASQAQHSSFRTGATDRQEAVTDDYEFVFDESQTIQFVMDTTLGEGTQLTPAEKLLQSQIEEAEKRGKSAFTHI
jgi:pre-mRNA-splicing factor ATP-dependent RNA helicase DHX16